MKKKIIQCLKPIHTRIHIGIIINLHTCHKLKNKSTATWNAFGKDQVEREKKWTIIKIFHILKTLTKCVCKGPISPTFNANASMMTT